MCQRESEEWSVCPEFVISENAAASRVVKLLEFSEAKLYGTRAKSRMTMLRKMSGG